MVASMVPRNSKAVRSAPEQTATFPEKSLVRLLAVVVGSWCWCWGVSCLHVNVDPYECVATSV